MSRYGPKPRPAGERFWSYVNKTDGCWEWIGASDHGYGSFRLSNPRVQMRAHRFSWEQANGPIPDGLSVLHRCDNRRCVRPDHLFLGTLADNNADARAKGRHAHGESHGRRKLTALQVEQIRRLRSEGELLDVIARAYQVSEAQVSLIVRGLSWYGGNR